MRIPKFVVVSIAGLAMVALAMGPIFAQQGTSTPSSQLLVSGEVFAEAQRVHTYTYDWLISKSVTPTSAQLVAGQSANLVYRLDVTRNEPVLTTVFRTSITATVTNQATGPGGANTGPTSGLSILAQVVAQVPGTGDVVAGTGTTPAITELGSGQSREYVVVVTYTPVPLAVNYRIEIVAADSMSSVMGQTGFTPPALATDAIEVDAVAHVTDQFTTTPAGFSVAYGGGVTWPRTFTGTGSYQYAVTLTNSSAAAPYVGSLENTATLTKGTTVATKTATATVAVTALAPAGGTTPSDPPGEPGGELPAAPAIATRLLKAAGIANRYGQGRTGGNYVAAVARMMGRGAAFPAFTAAGTWDGQTYIPKTDQVAYQAAVKAFLQSKGANLP